MQVARHMLHSQLRAMINTSTGTLHTLSRTVQADPEIHPQLQPYEQQPHHYEQSGLYIMVDPETGKPMGGQLVQPGQIIPEAPQQHNILPEQHSSNPQEGDEQNSDQHVFEPGHHRSSDDTAARGTKNTSVSARNSACDPSGQEGSVRSSTNAHTDPIELLTPAIDQPQGDQCSEENQPGRAVSPMPALSMTSLADPSPAVSEQIVASGAAGSGPLQGMSDVDEHGLASLTTGQVQPRSDRHSTCTEIEDEYQDNEVGTTKGDVQPGASEQVRGAERLSGHVLGAFLSS